MHLLTLFKELSLQPQSTADLRGLILDLAIRGRLTADWRKANPAVEPASALLERIQAEKARLVREKKIRKGKPLPPIDPDEVPFDLPEGWVWCRLIDLVALKSGTSFKKSEELSRGDYLYIKVGTMNLPENKEVITTSDMHIKHSSRIEKYLIPAFSIVFPKRGGAIATNKKRIVKAPLLVDLNTMAITPVVSEAFDYLKIWFDSIDLWSLNNGTSVPQINNKDIEPLLFPLPPLPEQRAIVQVVDQLLAEVDALEAQLQRRVQLQDDYVTAALRELTTQASAPAWAALQPHFKAAFASPARVDQLRQAILQLAVQGQLTAPWRAQHPDTEPASVLLERIKAEKARLVQEKKIRKEKPLPPIDAEEVPFPVPEGWVWCRMIDLCQKITDGTHHTPTYTETGIPFLSVKNLSSGFLDFQNTRFISVEEHQNLIQRCHPERGDVLLTKVGTTGIAVAIDTDREFSIFVSVALLKIFNKELLPQFVEHCINSPLIKRQSSDGTEGVGNKNLVLRKIKAFSFPLPPLAEQRAIVALVDQLLGWCADLEAALGEQAVLVGDLRTAAVREVMG